MKWFMLITVLAGDLMLLAALLYIILWWHSWLGIILGLIVYTAWKENGGFKNWKIKNMKRFLQIGRKMR